jgi:hypothetical protein
VLDGGSVMFGEGQHEWSVGWRVVWCGWGVGGVEPRLVDFCLIPQTRRRGIERRGRLSRPGELTLTPITQRPATSLSPRPFLGAY